MCTAAHQNQIFLNTTCPSCKDTENGIQTNPGQKLFIKRGSSDMHNQAINYAPAAPDARTSRRLLRR